MNNFELKQLRQLLFLSQAEAAKYIGDVEPRSWQRWEKGTSPIPTDVISQMQMLSLTRQDLLDSLPDFDHYNYKYFDTIEEYAAESGVKSVVKWRLSQSVAAQLFSEKSARIWRAEEIIRDED
ncbi:DUF1870 family protein [Providencia sp. wls1922]|jgi:DNA-binding XRE family transcriptional regulator|uniref:Aca2/YdiL-like domain-containing protein n=1 Tax=Providencia sp. wls1922 TaxID=2675152 RepID=UPI0012B5341A|nr:DUF1870 family protein [Providencia sp. wls1922]